MSIESVIGIIASLLTIAMAFGIKFEVIDVDVFNKRPAKEVFDNLLSKKTTDAKRKKLLKKLNKYEFFNKQIKKEYINSFELKKRGPEELLFDICDKNNIVPTDDMCKSVLGYVREPLKTKYLEKRQAVKNEPTIDSQEQMMNKKPEVKVINPFGEQIVYLSEELKKKYPNTCDKLIGILDKHHVKYSFLKATKDIWCRDYMPVQTPSGRLIQFTYDPSYLRGNKEWEDSRSDVRKVCKENGFTPEFSNINIDGGNVLICEDRAILTDRIYSENPGIDKETLKSKLADLLECEIIIIPAYRSKEDDLTGHADGMVRFVDRNTIIGNCLANEYQYIKEGVQKAINDFNLQYIEMPFFIDKKDPKHPYSAIGVYVNYLEVNNLIVMPVFGRKEEDEKAINVMKATFPDRIIETINYNDVALEGGLLNCTTWVLKQ